MFLVGAGRQLGLASAATRIILTTSPCPPQSVRHQDRRYGAHAGQNCHAPNRLPSAVYQEAKGEVSEDEDVNHHGEQFNRRES